MNRVILMGRLTREPEVTYSNNANVQMAIARYTLAVERRFKRENDTQTADFIRCVAFGKNGEFAEKYLHQGTKIVAEGRIQTGSYTDRETGKTVYTTDIVVESQEFAESKAAASNNSTPQSQPQPMPQQSTIDDGFISVPDNIDDTGLPFNF